MALFDGINLAFALFTLAVLALGSAALGRWLYRRMTGPEHLGWRWIYVLVPGLVAIAAPLIATGTAHLPYVVLAAASLIAVAVGPLAIEIAQRHHVRRARREERGR